MGRILGIDQSFTSSGLVVLEDNGDIIHAERYESNADDDIYKRAWDISEHILKIANQFQPEQIMIEGLSFTSIGNNTRNLSGLQFIIMTNLRFNGGFKIETISPTSVKKLACGKGKATKTEIINSLPLDILTYFKTLGYKKTQGLPDLADAYFIAKSYLIKTQNPKK